jgi:regulator of replication initiation timing
MEELDYIIKTKEEIKSLQSEIEESKKVISNLQKENKNLKSENENLKSVVSQCQKEVKVLDRKSTEALEAVSRKLDEANRRIAFGLNIERAYNRMIEVISDHSSLTQQRFRVEMSDFKEFYNRLIEASKVIDED